jgi:hypothetical protein
LTGQCGVGGPHPSFGLLDCGDIGVGLQPQQCCPGQACICPPIANEFNTACFFYGCWNQGDIPGVP